MMKVNGVSVACPLRNQPPMRRNQKRGNENPETQRKMPANRDTTSQNTVTLAIPIQYR